MRELSFSHMFGGKTHDSAMMLADKLASMVPLKNARVFLGNSGSDANDTLMNQLHITPSIDCEQCCYRRYRQRMWLDLGNPCKKA